MSDTIDIVHTKSGASVKIHPFGGTVISYKSPSGRENLFVSRDAKLDGTKAIRGGIPLVFPIFGPPPADSGSSMPQHGFARCNTWKIKEGSRHDEETHAGITLTLDLADASAGRGEGNPWSEAQSKVDGTACRLLLEVKLDDKSLTTTLVVQNTGSDAFTFNCLQHTYFLVDGRAAQDPTQCYVEGLEGYSIVDKVGGVLSGQVCSGNVDLTAGEVDRVYVHPENKMTARVSIGIGNNNKMTLEAFGEIDETPVPVSVVVWNPSEAKAKGMSDFGDDQYQDMICVEPGLLGHQPVLAPGKEARFTQVILP